MATNPVINLNVVFNEESTGAIGFSFTDLDGNAVTPNDFFWTLTDDAGTVINLREDVEISPPAATTYVVLQGDDLAITGDNDVERLITIYGTFNTTIGGVSYPNSPYTEDYKFNVKALLKIPGA